MRKKIIAGNWKMNMTIEKGVKFIENIKDRVKNDDVEVLICAPFTLLKDLKNSSKGTNIKIGAQNMHFEDSGAFTGEVSAEMLNEIGVDYVIIGHSERREYFAETDETCNKKLKQAFKNKIMPILCVGETLEEREKGKVEEKLKMQISKGLNGLDKNDVKNMIIAYEPIWAIGTGKTATSDEANDTIKIIREEVKNIFGSDVSDSIRIQYGGSVKPNNVKEIMGMSDIDGALVGGASLKEDDYVSLVNFNK